MLDDSASSLRDLWDEHADAWAAHARSPGVDEFFRSYNWPAFVELLPPCQGRVLEVGCGEGRIARALRELRYEVVALDGSVRMVRLAAEGTGERDDGVDAMCGDASFLPFTDEVFDLVVAFMSLQDVDDLAGAVAEIARALRPGGSLCLAVLHPFDTAGSFDSEEPDAEFRLQRPYPRPARLRDEVERDGLRMVFHVMHRPVSAYLNELIRHGLVIDEVREPVPTDAVVSEIPRLARQQTRTGLAAPAGDQARGILIGDPRSAGEGSDQRRIGPVSIGPREADEIRGGLGQTGGVAGFDQPEGQCAQVGE